MSKTDRRIGKKVPDYIRREDAPGVRFDSGPYIGKIKNNYDTIRQGRLQVWIPDLGAGDENDVSNWRTVSYASPFFGSTSQEPDNKKNTFKDVRHTYGFWFTPPDVDNFVMCTFIAGDPQRGFWFACVPSQLGQHMVPGISGSNTYDTEGINSGAVKKMKKPTVLPTVDFNENKEQDWSDFTNIKKPLHEPQIEILLTQGLDRDLERGVMSSSSQRESPSRVFGISTPGQPFPGASKDEFVYTRNGGHTFVMDDGDFSDKNRIFRLRSSGGHQIIMNDSQDIFYIGNSKGTAWVELTEKGEVNIFSDKDINFRAKGDFNFHADKDFKINVGGKFSLFAKTSIQSESELITSTSSAKTTIFVNGVEIGSESTVDINPSGAGSFKCGPTLTMSAGLIKLNSGEGPTVSKPTKITVNNVNEAELDGSGQWQTKASALKSIASVVPTHEPWPRKGGKPSPAASGARSAAGRGSSSSSSSSSSGSGGSGSDSSKLSTGKGGAKTDSKGNPVVSGQSGGGSGPSSAASQGLKNPVPTSSMYSKDNPTPNKGVGPLDPIDKKALKTQIAHNESGGKYDAVEANRGNYLGKYQIGAGALRDEGYIKPDAYAKYGTKAVNYPSSWTGKGGVNSKEDFLRNRDAQEKSMDGLLDKNYASLRNTGGVQPGDSKEHVSGMLATSHLLGAGDATKWKNTGGGADANGTTGTSYYNMGRYASNVLAKKT